ncbi:MAG TPA: hypothetical protein VKB73_03715 [Gaiellaceae bacterium]|nr:hypothetical protein [Gaiellaceae bacterium]
MRKGILVGIAAVAAAATGSTSQAGSDCATALPSAPAGLPAPVVLRTTCGAYRAAPDGTLVPARPVRAPWWSPPGFRVAVRDGHVVVIKEGSVRWRSRRVYTVDSSEFDSVAFAPNKVAFSFIHGRLWVSRFDGHEHAVGWNEGALVWT